MSVADEIAKLVHLRDSGALTQEEFERAKARLLEPDAAPFARPDMQQARPFRRSVTDLWLGGVCGGLGALTGTDSWIWRLLFVIGLLAGGFSIVLYFLLWIFVPRAS